MEHLTFHNLGHVFHNCLDEHCRICSGGLAYCEICRCGEGTLLLFCPGGVVRVEDQEAIYAGKIVDLYRESR